MYETIPEFGIKRENEEFRNGGVAIVYDPKTNLYAVGKHTEDGCFRLFGGGVDEGEDIKEGVLREVIEESGLYDFERVEYLASAMAHYYNVLRKVNRVAKAACFIVILKSTDLRDVHLEEHEKFTLHWTTAEDILKNWEGNNQNKDLDHWVYFLNKGIARIKELKL